MSAIKVGNNDDIGIGLYIYSLFDLKLFAIWSYLSGSEVVVFNSFIINRILE